MKKILFIAAFSFLGSYFCSTAFAVSLNQPLPAVSVQNKGALALKPNRDEVNYRPWNTNELTGKIRVVQHLAGRMSVKKMNAPFVDALKAAKFNHDKYQTTTIVNLDDALIGTSGFVAHEVIANQRKYPLSSFVLDSNSKVRKAWHLSEKNCAIMVLDQQGKVLFFKDGALTQKEIDSIIALIRSHL